MAPAYGVVRSVSIGQRIKPSASPVSNVTTPELSAQNTGKPIAHFDA